MEKKHLDSIAEPALFRRRSDQAHSTFGGSSAKINNIELLACFKGVLKLGKREFPPATNEA
jgi:hypothetical protein